MIVTLIPAAGRSSRMGDRDKLLETIKGEPILARTARIACEADLGPVLVTLRPKDKARRRALRKHKHDVTVIEVPDADEGMSASLRTGGKAALELIIAHDESDYEYSGMMVLLPDMPEIEANDLTEIALNFSMSGGSRQRATTQDGRDGHPVLFPDHMLAGFQSLDGDEGARRMFEDEYVFKVPLAGHRALTDLDTPEEWAAWRARTGIKF